MAVFFNLNDKYKNTSIIYFDASIKVSKTDTYDDFIIFRDEDYNVNSINLLKSSLININKDFSILNLIDLSEFVKKILMLNKNYKFNEKPNFALGKIIKREVHPKSDKLFVLEVDFNTETRQIITNTTYTLENKYFFWCLPGSITANGLEITSGKVMNVDSLGMLCSSESLRLNEKEKGEFENFLENATDNNLGKDITEIFDFWRG
ncbi:phenylalanyl-tRNA synthetase subunit beta [Mycoplasmopsis maculosa]|uniref:Phenylalanyl-tRNA synthetase subunit beta n=1 Tax=Mycoplasmopsis maculosa TaxID=114885 RepID=A0A449B4E7_9BACT|nr:tRNA-binding protein [Mycoplasmopsis maculosa]VEU75408.1 phenylalanyl-tRNA synthetase subunit beta [Mycoplasmopsis maculosa]